MTIYSKGTEGSSETVSLNTGSVTPELDKQNPNVKTHTISQKVLKQQPYAEEKTASRWGGLWSWFGFGNKDSATPSSSAVIDKDEEEGDEGADELDSESSHQPLLAQEESHGTVVLGEDQASNSEEASEGKKEAFEEAASKTNQQGKGWFAKLGSSLYAAGTGLLGLTADVMGYTATKIVKNYVGRFARSTDKAALIQQEKQRIIENLNDPQMVEFTDFLSSVLVNSDAIKKKIKDSLPEAFKGEEQLLLDLIEINITRGLANLSQYVIDHCDDIPNFENQPSLVNVLSVLSQKGGKQLNRQKLDEIDLKYREPQRKVHDLTNKLFPDSQSRANAQKLMQEFVSSEGFSRRMEILFELFPNHVNLAFPGGQPGSTIFPEDNRPQVMELLESLNQLALKQQDLKQVFQGFADEILSCLFPKKLDDLVIPGILQSSSIPGSSLLPSYIYNNYIKGPIVEFLQESYASMEIDAVRTAEWKAALQSRVGVEDIDAVLEAPSAFIQGYTKNYLQTNPGAVEMVAEFLASASTPSKEDATDKETQKREELLGQLSQHQLADWMVRSIQSLLHTDDDHLLGLGEYFQQLLNHLTLGVLSKGAETVVPAGELVQKEHFIKELTDRLATKLKAMNSENENSHEFWKNFISTLPLPPVLHDALVEKLAKKTTEVQEAYNETFPITELLYKNTEKRIKSFKGGDQLLSIIEKVSDQIVDQVLEKNIDLIGTFELGDTVDDLLDQFFPGVTFDQSLKKWFKDNISSLGTSKEGASPQSVVVLKQAIKAVLRKAMINTIEMNFKNDGGAYAAQLLSNIHGAFRTAFAHFSSTERDTITKALDIQKQIEGKETKLAALTKGTVKKPVGLPQEQQTIIDTLLTANARVNRAETYTTHLRNKLKELLAKLGEKQGDEAWEEDHLNYLSSALVMRKMHALTLANPVTARAFQEQLRTKIDTLSLLILEDDVSHSETSKQLAELEMLDAILNMTAADLKVAIEALSTRDALNYSNTELQIAKEQLEIKKSAFDEASEQTIGCKTAIEWVEQKLKARNEITLLEGEIAGLKFKLDQHIGLFKVLSRELTKLLGLNQKDQLELPTALSNLVWPYIEEAKDEHIARLLFKQLAPVLLPALDLKTNQEKLRELSGGNEFYIELAKQGSEEIINRIPEFITSYKPHTEAILAIMGVEEPADAKDVERMEKALRDKLIHLGRKKATSSMLDPILAEIGISNKNRRLAQNLSKLIKKSSFNGFSKEAILTLIKTKDIKPGSAEEKTIQKQAEALAKALNAFLMSRGKSIVTNQDILQAYQTQAVPGQPVIDVLKVQEILNALQKAKIVNKIKTVVVTPEEIAERLNDFIPGATDLHTLIAPELQSVIVGKDRTFVENREFLQSYIEGMLLRLFIRLAEANKEKDQTIFFVIGRKLKGMIPSEKDLEGKSADEAARSMIDTALTDILNVTSSADFKGILLPLQDIAYEKLKEIAYQALTPIALPIVEVSMSRKALQKASGSKLLGAVSTALSKDLFRTVPKVFKSYRSMAAKIFIQLSEQTPEAAVLDKFVNSIALLAKNTKEKNLTNRTIVEAYAEAAGLTLSPGEAETLIKKLKESKLKEDIQRLVISPEEIADHIQEMMPGMDAKLRGLLIAELERLVHGNPGEYTQATELIQHYVEGFLNRLFLKIAEKNPPVGEKDSFIVMIEKMLNLAAETYEAAQTQAFETVAKEFNNAIFKDILGIDSPDSLKGLPYSMQAVVYDSIKDKIEKMLVGIHKNLQALEGTNPDVAAARANMRQFGADAHAVKSYGEIFAEDAANLLVATTPSVLAQFTGVTSQGATLIYREVENFLEDLSQGDLELAKILLNYSDTARLGKIVEGTIAKIADPARGAASKQKAAALITNLIAVPLNTLLQRTVDFEKKHGAAFNQKLMAGILQVIAGQLKTHHNAKQLAKAQGRSQILHKDFVAAAGEQLHPAVPKKAVDYQEAVNEILKRLQLKKLPRHQKKSVLKAKGEIRTMLARLIKNENQAVKNLSTQEIIREINVIYTNAAGIPLSKNQLKALAAVDAKGMSLKKVLRTEDKAPDMQRRKEFYAPETKSILKLLFPNGKNDLKFVPEEDQGKVWKLYKENLFPLVLPMIVEEIFAPDRVNDLVHKTLQKAKEQLNEEIIVSLEAPVDRPLDALDDASGALMSELFKQLQLPEWIKNKILNPTTGEVSDDMKQALGSTLRDQFNETFLKDTMENALKTAVERDPITGDYTMKPDIRSKEEKQAEVNLKRIQMEQDLKQLSREVVTDGISYFIEKTWKTAQAKFDARVKKVFGKVGLTLKRGLDALFRFTFFTILGSVLSFLFSPFKNWVKEKIFQIICLDENREIILDLLRRAPADQPETKGYAVFNEDMVYKVFGALHKTIDEVEEETLPQTP